jgi:hypothetical protein
MLATTRIWTQEKARSVAMGVSFDRGISCVAIGVLLAGPSYAACTKPKAPACATQTGVFEGVSDFDRCREQMLSYRDGMEAFAACLQQEGQSAQEQSAREEFQNTLAQFNRRARGE